MFPMSSMKAVVKTTFIACVLAAMTPVSAGLFGSSEIKQVKSAVINSATGLTYEKFFSGYQHAKSVDWSEEKIDGGRVTAVVVTLDHKDIENFSKNVQIEREKRREEKINRLKAEIRNEQNRQVQQLQLYEQEFERSGLMLGLKQVSSPKAMIAEKIKQDMLDSGVLANRDCQRFRCIDYPFGSTNFDRDVTREIELFQSDLSSLMEGIESDKKTIETTPASNTYRLKSARRDLEKKQTTAKRLKQELDTAQAVLSAYPAIYEKRSLEVKNEVRQFYAEAKEKAKTFVRPQTLTELQALEAHVQQTNEEPWMELRSISDTFIFVPVGQGKVNYLGGQTRFTWSDGKSAVVPRRIRSMEQAILHAIQTQQPIWTSSELVPVVGSDYVKSFYDARQ